MNLEDLARQPQVERFLLIEPGRALAALHCDSRQVNPQTAFLALKGLRTDGHRFLDDALARGAPALLVTEGEAFERLRASPPPGLGGLFLVREGRVALAELAGTLAGHPSRRMALYGVTGTNGKTTVTHLVAQLLRARGRPCALIGTLGMKGAGRTVAAERTTPEAPDLQGFLAHCLAQGVTAAAMEVSSIGIALERTRGLRFHAAAFTNLTQDHLDFHADLAVYREEKFRLFLEYDSGGAVANLDDPAGRELAGRIAAAGRGGALITFALEGPADLALEGVQPDGPGVRGRIRFRDEAHPFRFSLLGAFNRSNLLAAVGLLLAGGEPLEHLAVAAESCEGAPGRFERVPVPAPFTVVVDYAHSPDALENLLRAARPLTRGRLRLLFGCGGERDTGKRPLMGALAERLADEVVLTNDNPRGEDPLAILAAIRAGMRGTTPTETIPERAEAIRHLLARSQPGDLLLLAGKGDEAYQEIAGKKRPFSDRAVVLEWARDRGD
jgi:UDP-N-acetylmuramoyl-L-alanyl-D-glutamate--2,6-diaminopimelate ligase